MITRKVRIQLAVFGLVAILGILFAGGRYAGLGRLAPGYDPGYLVSADFSDSGGIFTGAEVTYRGVSVGKVEKLVLDDGSSGLTRLREPAQKADSSLTDALDALKGMLPTSQADPQYVRALTAVATAKGAVSGVNPVTGDYSRGAAGFLIENGALGAPVAEITIAGNLLDMFANLAAADDLEFRYAVNVPTLRIDGMTVAGA